MKRILTIICFALVCSTSHGMLYPERETGEMHFVFFYDGCSSESIDARMEYFRQRALISTYGMLKPICIKVPLQFNCSDYGGTQQKGFQWLQNNGLWWTTRMMVFVGNCTAPYYGGNGFAFIGCGAGNGIMLHEMGHGFKLRHNARASEASNTQEPFDWMGGWSNEHLNAPHLYQMGIIADEFAPYITDNGQYNLPDGPFCYRIPRDIDNDYFISNIGGILTVHYFQGTLGVGLYPSYYVGRADNVGDKIDLAPIGKSVVKVSDTVFELRDYVEPPPPPPPPSDPCGNGLCEPELGESWRNCPDCKKSRGRK